MIRPGLASWSSGIHRTLCSSTGPLRTSSRLGCAGSRNLWNRRTCKDTLSGFRPSRVPWTARYDQSSTSRVLNRPGSRSLVGPPSSCTMGLEDVRTQLFIGGKWVSPASTLDIVDPSTEGLLCTAPAASAEQVSAAVDAAKSAFKTWGGTSGAERAKYLRAIAEQVRQRKKQLGNIDAQNSGKPLPEAEWDMDDVATCFDYYAGLAEELDAKQGEDVDVGTTDYKASIRYEPMGVVAAIVPWNYPLLMATWKVAPALAAGCTVVLKPSELTPLSALELGDIANAVGLPPGVLNVINGLGSSVGAALVGHPDVHKITFTGSVPTGQSIARVAAESVTPVTLELGGKSPALVFDSYNLARTVEWVMFGCFWTNGQICSATSRLLVQEDIAEQFLATLVEEVKKIKIGAPLEEGTKLGPLVSEAQHKKVLGMIQTAKEEGARLLTGGKRPDHLSNGWYVEPTVFCNVSKDMELWKEEVFGPVLAVMTFKTEEEGIALANDTQYGLAGAVFSADEAQLTRVTRRLQCGIVWQNCSQPCFCQLPWGGFKRSGVGRDLGKQGILSYTQSKQVVHYRKDEDLGWYLQSNL